MAEKSEFGGLDHLNKRLGEIAANARTVKRPLISSAVYMLGSIEKNFQAQGRPRKWSPLNPRTLASRRKRKATAGGDRQVRRGSRILIDTVRLKNSMSFNVEDESAEIGTNVVYAARHHFGYPGGKGRGRSKTPARPFLLVQAEDIRKIEEIFSRHLRK